MSKSGVGTFVVEDHELASSGLALFDPPIVDTSLTDGKFINYYCKSQFIDSGPFEFIVPSDGVDFIDLPYTRFEGCVEITKPDNSAITATELNAYVNLFPHSLFKQVECFVNNVQIADLSAPTYAYKAYIESILTFPPVIKDSTLQLEYYDKDTLGKEEIYVKADCTSFDRRHTLAMKGKMYFSILLHLDFFHCTRFLLPGCELKFKFIRSPDTFSLLGATEQTKIRIHDLKLKMRKITVNQAIADKIEEQLRRTPAIYPLAQSKIKAFSFNKDIKNIRVSNIHTGVLPRSLIICFVDTRAYNGAIEFNPFKFQHFGLNSFQAFINGAPVLKEPYRPNFSKNDFYDLYRAFMDNLGWAHDSNSNGITMEEYKTNSFFIPLDLSPDLSNGATLSPLKEGNLDFLIDYEKNLTENITMLVFGTFNEIVLIDHDRNVTVV